jgi:dihydrofolate reductase
MRFWQIEPSDPDAPPAERAFAELWRRADKVVFSSTLSEVTTPRTRLAPRFDAELVRELKESSRRDLSIGGAAVAAAALRAGLVDEIGMYVTPVVVGGGTRLLPDGIRLDLELVEERRFGNGVVLLRYTVARGRPS